MKRIVSEYTVFLFLITSLLTACKGTPEKDSLQQNTKGKSVQGEEVSYSTDTTEMRGYLAYDQNLGVKRPGVLVVHEWWGHNEYSRKRARMLAELGYTALAVDMYGDGKQAAHPEDAGKFSGMVMQNMDAAQARFDAAMELLKSHSTVNPEQIAAIGYCFGGSVVLTMANAGKDLDAVAAFHSGVQLPVMPNDKLKARVLVCNGTADPFISGESEVAFTRAMDSINADYEYISYEEAKHSFTSHAADSLGRKFDLPLEYQKKADEDSWKELQKFLDETFE
jgi:dienelactone hydrolase